MGECGGRGKQVYDYLKKNSSVNVIYPLEELLKAKSKGLLYYKNDTHWNEMGAFIGYSELMKKCAEDFPELKYIKLEDMNIESYVEPSGDLARMLQVEGIYNIDTEYPCLTKNENYDFRYREHKGWLGIDGVYTFNDEKNINTVFLRDSYAMALIPYISQTFGNVKYIWEYDFVKNINSIKTEKPQIVVSEFVERYLYILAQPDPIIKEDI